MPGLDISQWLNAGGLGVLAFLCLVVLGHNAWSLNSLIRNADPKRIDAARTLLLAQMAISLIGLLMVGGGAIFLDLLKVQDKQDRRAEVTLLPWDEDLDARYQPRVSVNGRTYADRPISVACTPNDPIRIRVNFNPYVLHRLGISAAGT